MASRCGDCGTCTCPRGTTYIAVPPSPPTLSLPVNMTGLRAMYVQQIPSPCAVPLNPGFCRFLELNTDALLHIFDCLQHEGALFSFSMTCWAMREAAMPVLFNSCRILVKEPIDEDHFIPRSLWPYIRYSASERKYHTNNTNESPLGHCL